MERQGPFFSARCPTEITLAIFTSCQSLRDVAALIITNRHTAAVWNEHQGHIILHIGRLTIPAFDCALMAVS